MLLMEDVYWGSHDREQGWRLGAWGWWLTTRDEPCGSPRDAPGTNLGAPSMLNWGFLFPAVLLFSCNAALLCASRAAAARRPCPAQVHCLLTADLSHPCSRGSLSLLRHFCGWLFLETSLSSSQSHLQSCLRPLTFIEQLAVADGFNSVKLHWPLPLFMPSSLRQLQCEG